MLIVGRLVVQNKYKVCKSKAQSRLFSLIRGCDFDCAFLFAEPGVKGLLALFVIKLRGFIKMLVLTRSSHQSIVVGNEVESMVVDAVVYGMGTEGEL